MSPHATLELDLDGRTVKVANPDRVVFPELGITRADLVDYYLFAATEVLRGVAGRPMILKRYLKGAAGEHFFQKRVPKGAPEWLETAVLHYDSGHRTEEIVVRDAAGLAYVLSLGCIDLNPNPVQAEDVRSPDELRVDLDPTPGVTWPNVVAVALLVREVLEEHGLVGFPKTSGSRGMHIYSRLAPGFTFEQGRSAALALAREVEARADGMATSQWRKQGRKGVFVDYNQNARDRTTASVYSVRPTPDARVSTALSWDEVPFCDPADFTIETVPERLDEIGDPWSGMALVPPGSLDSLLQLAHGQEPL